jgi:uncharacterized protein YpuA (DUF1002 family)
MKKKIYLLIIPCVMIAGKTLGQQQTPDKTIPIDFKTLQSTYDKNEIDKGKTFVIQISNINRNLYKVTGVKTETDYNSAVPAALTGIKLPEYLYNQMPNQTAMKALPGGGARTSAQILADIKVDLKTINDAGDNINKSTILFNEITHLSKNCADDSQTIINKAVAKCNAYLGQNLAANQVAAALELFLNSKIDDATAALKKLQDDITDYETAAQKELNNGHADYLKNLDQAKKQSQDPHLSRSNKQAALQTVSDYQEKVNGFTADKATLSSMIDQIKANQTKAQSAVQDMQKFRQDDKIYTVVKLFQKVANPDSYIFTSELIKAKTDEISYVITIEPTDINDCPGMNSIKTVTVTVKVNGGLKIDFSTGAFVNFGSKDFLGQTYYYQNIDADNRQILSANRGSRALFSIGALMHFYKRSTAPVKLGGSLGVSTSANLADLNFHVGPSLFIGSKNRIVLTGGMTLKSSSLLDENLKTNTPYTKLQSPDAIPTVSVFPTRGWFLALTYNFTKLPNK